MLKDNETIIDKEILSEIISDCRKFHEIEDAFKEFGIRIVEDEQIRNIEDVLKDISKMWNRII